MAITNVSYVAPSGVTVTQRSAVIDVLAAGQPIIVRVNHCSVTVWPGDGTEREATCSYPAARQNTDAALVHCLAIQLACMLMVACDAHLGML
jgi:type III secretory pathway component EscT